MSSGISAISTTLVQKKIIRVPISTNTAAAPINVDSKTAVCKRRLELVISHYEENLSWLNELDWALISCVYIYHKGDSSKTAKEYQCPIPSSTRIDWVVLNNVGRESHTIMYHCLQMKHGSLVSSDSRNQTLFVQGGMDQEHLRCSHTYPVNQWHKYLSDTVPYHCAHQGEIWNAPKFLKHHSKWLDEKTQGAMKRTTLSLAEFYFYMSRRFYPKHSGIVVSFGNFFSVWNTRIMQHSAALYERGITILGKHVNPEEGHYFERICRSLFSGHDINVHTNANTHVNNVVKTIDIDIVPINKTIVSSSTSTAVGTTPSIELFFPVSV